jgi:carbonic anhydrase/acetyltransferase-like protein (isoleucine patch superfamily)
MVGSGGGTTMSGNRGNVSYVIIIGNKVTVGDRVMVHCSGVLTNHPTKIGNNVVIGAGAIIHGCTIEDECYIGSGAQVLLDGAVIQKMVW